MFIDSFTDELEKIALVGSALKGIGGAIVRHPGKAFLGTLLGLGAYQGAKAAAGRRGKRIAASPSGPSKAWYINYHKALGLPRRLTAPQRERLHRYFAKYREKQ